MKSDRNYQCVALSLPHSEEVMKRQRKRRDFGSSIMEKTTKDGENGQNGMTCQPLWGAGIFFVAFDELNLTHYLYYGKGN